MNIQLGVICTNMVDYGRPGHIWAELLGSIAVHFLTFYVFMKLHFIFTESSQATVIPTTQLYSISVCLCKVTLCVYFCCVYILFWQDLYILLNNSNIEYINTCSEIYCVSIQLKRCALY